MLAPPDAATELVQLRKPETLRAFYYHNCRVWHINTNLYNRSCNYNIYFAGAKIIKRFFFLACRLLAMEHCCFKFRKNFARDMFVFFFYGFALVLAGINPRADHKCLPACFKLAANVIP